MKLFMNWNQFELGKSGSVPGSTDKNCQIASSRPEMDPG